jgi:hypothetical protein
MRVLNDIGETTLLMALSWKLDGQSMSVMGWVPIKIKAIEVVGNHKLTNHVFP